MRRAIVGATTLCFAGGGLGAAAAAEGPATSSGAIVWHACADTELVAAGVECGDLTVPLDRADPAGRQITVALSRLPATAPVGQRQGPLLINSGGPGFGDVATPAFLPERLPADVLGAYDVIGFDPRGVGASTPALSCGSGSEVFGERLPDLRPSTAPAESPGPSEAAWLELYSTFVAGCEAESGDLLPHMTSADVVADMDAIRAALGAESITFYGFSYGTYLGQLYASTYPERTRRMVLDGNIDAAMWGYPDIVGTARGSEASVQEFFAWVADHAADYGLGATAAEVEAAYYRGEQLLRENPNGLAGPAEWNAFVLQSLYAQELWPDAAEVFAALDQGDIGPLEEAIFVPEGTTPEEEAAAAADNDNVLAAYYAVRCGDAMWPDDYDRWRADIVAADAVAPFATWAWALQDLGCRVWPYEKELADVDGADAPELLLASTAADPATPLVNSLSVRLEFPDSVLVVDTGTTAHTATLADNACVDEQVFAYLRTGELPDRDELAAIDATCPGLPLPEPTDAEAEPVVIEDESPTPSTGDVSAIDQP